MASKREQILAAIAAALSGLAADVERDADVPEAVSSRGLLVVQSVAAEIAEAALGGAGWYMRLDVPVEVYVAGADAGTRAERLDALLAAAADAIRGDPALAGLATYVLPTGGELESLIGTGRTAFMATQMSVLVEYDADKPTG